MAIYECRECGGSVSSNAAACPHCGAPQRTANERPVAVHVHAQKEESVLFAVLTLVAWIVIGPVGFVMNIVGLFTGPRRGCFVAMACVFILLPLLLIVGGVWFAESGIDPEVTKEWNEFKKDFKRELDEERRREERRRRNR